MLIFVDDLLYLTLFKILNHCHSTCTENDDDDDEDNDDNDDNTLTNL